MAKRIEKPSIRRTRREKNIKAQKASMSGNKRYDAELRRLQKVANERMRQLEMQDIKSPAYKAVQARLEILGKERKGNRGRRFSETGKGTYNEREMQKKILREFLAGKTATVSGAKDYYDRVWATANKDDKLSNLGITRDQWFEFFENLPDQKKDRMFYSQQVKIFKEFMRKNGELVDKNKLTVEQIANSMQNAEQLNDVYKNLNKLKKNLTRADKKKFDNISILDV